MKILAPVDGAQAPPLVALQLQGDAGSFAGTLSWTSNLDGPLGTGKTVTWKLPSPGLHLVTLDAGGAKATVRVQVLGAGGPGSKDLQAYADSLLPALFGQPIGLLNGLYERFKTNKTDCNAVSGSGGLTAGVSRSGVITTLRWPSPGDNDHIDWLTQPQRADGYGQSEGMGVFAGVAVVVNGKPLVSFFREPGWTTSQRYMDDDGAVVVTRHENAALGVRAVETAFVHPAKDVLVHRVALEALPGGPSKARLIYYENLAPTDFNLPYAPINDWILDVLADFAAGYHSQEKALVHFRPKNADYLSLFAFALKNSSQSDIDKYLEGASGIVTAIGGDAPADDFQVGADALGAGPASGPGALDAYADAQDGQLGKNTFAAARANAALAWDMTLPSSRAVYVAFGPTLDGNDGARTALRWARASNPDTLLQETRSWWSAQLAKAKLPKTNDPDVIRMSKRTLVTILNARCRTSGAIVAGVATQLPYALDWVRDGAFINLALDEAGYTDIVAAHNDFYVKVQRKGFILPGSFDMNFRADGTPGGPLPFEIDECALGVWTLAEHRLYETDPAKRAAYLQRVFPAIRRGAELLRGWTDPFSGMPLPANEDDSPALTSGLHGGTAILAGLAGAIDAGVEIKEPKSVVDGWRARKKQLEDALRARFWDTKVNGYKDTNPFAESGPQWALWPGTLLPQGDARLSAHADFVQRRLDDLLISKKINFSGYDAKSTLALATRFHNDPVRRAACERSFLSLMKDLPTTDTGHFGEFYELTPTGDWRICNNTPHVWEHSLMFATAMRLYK